MLKWFWSMLGYKTENDIKRQMVLDHQFKMAKIYLEKSNEEAKKIDNGSKKELSQKQKEQIKGWSKDYACIVKKELKKHQKGKSKKHEPEV
tara:strand:+ start:120 stop:392 length:273 start_codon:yes stop_codon:yes gene_type:complete